MVFFPKSFHQFGVGRYLSRRLLHIKKHFLKIFILNHTIYLTQHISFPTSIQTSIVHKKANIHLFTQSSAESTKEYRFAESLYKPEIITYIVAWRYL